MNNNLITLGIETSTDNLSLAILKDKSILASSEIICRMNHDKYIISIIKSLLNTSEIKKEDINLITVGCGPGAFTSLRVGIAFARTFAQINKIDIVPVSTLDTIKENINEIIEKINETHILSIIKAKQNKVYASIYRKKETIEQNLLIDIDMLIQKLQKILRNKSIFIIGNATEKYKPIFKEKLSEIYTLPDYYNYPHSYKTATIGQKIFKEKGSLNFNNIKPFYIN